MQVVLAREWCRAGSSVHDSLQGTGQGENEADLDEEAQPPDGHQLLSLLHVQCKHILNVTIIIIICSVYPFAWQEMLRDFQISVGQVSATSLRNE